MKISGLQKLTLLDYPGKVACTVFLFGCNLRCPFCHNASLALGIEQNEIKYDELMAFLDKRKGLLQGVCVTGGEPLINKDIAVLLADIKSRGFLVKLDTNGTDPDLLKDVTEAGYVDYIAMDIKNSLEKYPLTVGHDVNTDDIKKSISYIMGCGKDYEFRTTVVKGYHTDDDFRSIGKLIRGTKKYFLQNFVDSGDLIGINVSGFSREEMLHFLNSAREYIPEAEVRGI